jgi:hypothetical protein
MSSQDKKIRVHDLKSAIPLSREDSRVMGAPPCVDPPDLAGYLEFLDEIGAFEVRKQPPRIYDEIFELPTRANRR